MSGIVTYSKNVFIPLTRVCRNSCKYCNFRMDLDGFELDNSSLSQSLGLGKLTILLSLKDVENLAAQAAKRGCKEALLTFGERPEVYTTFRKIMRESGYTFLEYIVEACKTCIKAGLLPHTNAGVLFKDEMKKLKPFNASMGLMLEQAVELDCHKNSPGKNPEVRIKTIERAGKLRIPFTTGILLGIGESVYDRFYSLEVISDLHENYGHIQEIIVQPCVVNEKRLVSFKEIKEVVECAKRITTVQIPPNLVSKEELLELLKAGASDLGGISPLTQDYINPEHPWPSISALEEFLRENRYLICERLPVYPELLKMGLHGWCCEVSSLISQFAESLPVYQVSMGLGNLDADVADVTDTTDTAEDTSMSTSNTSDTSSSTNISNKSNALNKSNIGKSDITDTSVSGISNTPALTLNNSSSSKRSSSKRFK